MKDFDAKSFVNEFTDKLYVHRDEQDINEVRASMLELAKNIARSDLTSSYITNKRIESMRVLLDLFESYNDQLKDREFNCNTERLLDASGVRRERLVAGGEKYHGVIEDVDEYVKEH